jgi:hypothetical protein
MRKKTNEEAVIKNILYGFYLTAIHVHSVGYGLECEERNSYREDELIHTEMCSEKGVTEMREMIEKFNVGSK